MAVYKRPPQTPAYFIFIALALLVFTWTLRYTVLADTTVGPILVLLSLFLLFTSVLWHHS